MPFADPAKARAYRLAYYKNRRKDSAYKAKEREQERARYWIDPEKMRARKRALDALTKGGLKRYYVKKSNPETFAKLQEQRRKWRQQNNEKMRAYIREWASTERGKLTVALCRARRAGIVGTHTLEQWLARVEFYGWRCAYCRILLVRETLTKDHVIPVSKGGTNFASNLVPCCKPCNSKKHNKSCHCHKLRPGNPPRAEYGRLR